MALIIFFGAGAKLFGSDYFFLEPELSLLALIIFFGARAELIGSEFLFWSLSRSLKFSKPARALVGSLKFLLVSQDPFIGLVIAVFSPLFLQETILISRQEKAGG